MIQRIHGVHAQRHRVSPSAIESHSRRRTAGGWTASARTSRAAAPTSATARRWTTEAAGVRVRLALFPERPCPRKPQHQRR
jgi:hypothetical protein